MRGEDWENITYQRQRYRSWERELEITPDTEEKGKAVNLETDEEEEDLEDIIIEEDKDEGMGEETEDAVPLIEMPAYASTEGEDEGSQGPRWEQELSADFAPPRWYHLWSNALGKGVDRKIQRLGSH